MPIQFKNTPQSAGHSPVREAQKKVRGILGLPDEAKIHVGMSVTTVVLGGVKLMVPLGMVDVMKDTPAVAKAQGLIHQMFGKSGDAIPDQSVGISTPAPAVVDPDCLPDEEWAYHVGTQMFPQIVPLPMATQIYQPVQGQEPGSVYVTSFIGPTLRGAARLKDQTISFRFQTGQGTAPGGEVKAILNRLGVQDTASDRMTCHVKVGGNLANNNPEFRAIFGAFYGALRPHLTSNFPDPKRVFAN